VLIVDVIRPEVNSSLVLLPGMLLLSLRVPIYRGVAISFLGLDTGLAFPRREGIGLSRAFNCTYGVVLRCKYKLS
jgi:hypothetical protein